MPKHDLTPGCYLDGSRGHYITRDAIRFACEHGFPIDPADLKIVDAYDDHYTDPDYPHEELNHIADDAIEYLNLRRRVGAHYWEFRDGDFGAFPEHEQDVR